MGIKEAVVLRFQELCRQKNISYNQLAVRSGVTPSTVYSMMDKSRTEISITTIKKLCDGLEMNIADFFETDTFRGLEQEMK